MPIITRGIQAWGQIDSIDMQSTPTTNQKADSNPDSNVTMGLLLEVVRRWVTIGLLSAILFV
jgi:hypothetical protein